MTRIDWNRAKRPSKSITIADESKRRDGDAAARFLAKMGWPAEGKSKPRGRK